MEIKAYIEFGSKGLDDLMFKVGYSDYKIEAEPYGIGSHYAYKAFLSVYRDGTLICKHSFILKGTPAERDLGILYTGKELVKILEVLVADGRTYIEYKDVITKHYSEQDLADIKVTAEFWEELFGSQALSQLNQIKEHLIELKYNMIF